MVDSDAFFEPLLPPGADVITTPDGVEVTARVGSVVAERLALAEGALAVDRAWRSLLRLGGEDRVRFLHGVVTCDVQALTPGDGAYGFFTDVKGRVLADAVVLATEESLLVDVPRSRADALLEHLTKYIIADRVEPSLVPARSFLLAGPNAAARWKALGGTGPGAAAWSHAEASVEGIQVGVVDERRVGTAALALWVDSEQASDLLAVLAGETPQGGWSAVDATRIEHGIPWFGIDFSEENIPQETSIRSAVSFEKGCYLGQEVVARVHFLGKASRALRRVRFAAGPEAAAGNALTADGRELGTLTSVTKRPDGSRLGIASIHRRVEEEGLQLDVAGTRVEISEVHAL